MDGFGGYYAQWDKSDTERQMPYDITYMWNPKYNKLVSARLSDWTELSECNKTEANSDIENKLVVTNGERKGGGLKEQRSRGVEE